VTFSVSCDNARVLPWRKRRRRLGRRCHRHEHPSSSARCLCRYLHSEPLRREINEGLNVIEHWNSANDFIFFARRGEFASNRREDHEISIFPKSYAKRILKIFQRVAQAFVCVAIRPSLKEQAIFVAQFSCRMMVIGNRSMQQALAYDFGKIPR
jgi:hypothetical protein